VQESINTRHGVERIVRYAFELAASPARRGKLTLVHKTNVLTFAGDLYQRVVDELAAEFPSVETDYVHVDAACIYFLDWPARFDVIVTDNMFGDIITDLGAMIQGGMGIAAGGNINPARRRCSSRSAAPRPSETGKGTINPLAAIGRMEMLLRQLGEAEAAERVDRGIRARDRQDAQRCVPARWASRTAEVGDLVVEGRGVSRRAAVELYDTTLRDGAQGTGLSYSIEDRLRILHKLDQLGVPYIEGGWPGANPRDTEFFKLATKETLQHATLTSFGMTRRAGGASRGQRRAARAARHRHRGRVPRRQVLALHVTEALRDRARRRRRDGARLRRVPAGAGAAGVLRRRALLRRLRGRPEFSLSVLVAPRRPVRSGSCCATRTAACCRATCRGSSTRSARAWRRKLGIHVHNDAGCAVANSLIAVEHGAFQVQGVVNGYGERTGNADLIPIAANLVLKMGADCLPEGAVEHLTEVAHYVAEVANLAPDSRQPYAGRYAFTHKAGLHASGVRAAGAAYEHVAPASVGNRRGVVASDLGGAATLRMKAAEFGLEVDDAAVGRALEDLKERESRGYTFEVADASLDLLMRRAGGWQQDFFRIESYRVHVEERVGDAEPPLAEATVKVETQGTRHIESAEGRARSARWTTRCARRWRTTTRSSVT
jgi:2-isopropylmalate synthase